jgi:hypothetical protein
MVSLAAWPEQEAFLRHEHTLMSGMDAEQLGNYLSARNKRDVEHWKMILVDINKAIEAAKQAREKADGKGKK